MAIRRKIRCNGCCSGSDRGATALEFLLVFPAVLLAVLLALSAGLWFHARNIALSAAQEGVRMARTYQDAAAAAPVAEAFANESGDGILLNPTATVVMGQTIDVTVQGQALTLIPGLELQVVQVARAPQERFTVPDAQ